MQASEAEKEPGESEGGDGMTLISCAHMRIETTTVKKSADVRGVICTHPGYEGYCLVHWETGTCPCADEVLG